MTDRTNRTAVRSVGGQKPPSETNTTLCEHPDALARLFDGLTDGQTPDFLSMMAALSDISILVTPDGKCSDCRIPA